MGLGGDGDHLRDDRSEGRHGCADQQGQAERPSFGRGGPFASSTPDAPELDLADFKILDEGEITLPMLYALERGQTGGRFTAEGGKPDVTAIPIPRFDLLQLEAYDSMSVQFSRGCPFNCEFCDIIVLYGC